jgi:hypothetical protein
MRKIATVLAAAALMVAGASWQAQANMERGPAALSHATGNFTPIEKAACGGRYGAHCPPGRHWVCGPHRCWCAPC